MNAFDFTVSLTGDLEKDIISFFDYYNLNEIKIHTISVANKARELANIYQYDSEQAYIAGLLHDIGQVVPNDQRVVFCENMGISVINEERIVPALLHSKISQHLARKMFMINNEDILSAVECHSTLRKKASCLDKLLFVADKLQWDDEDNAPFVNSIHNGLSLSLEHAAYAILDYFVGPNPAAYVMHPWTVEAYNDLKASM